MARLLFAVAILLAAAPAVAQDREAIERARDHMERGQTFYTSGRFVEAAEEFQRAYEAQPFSAFLYNAAVAYERLDDPTRSADFFSRYLERDPEATDATEVRSRIDRLRTR